MISRDELALVSGVRETALHAGLLAALPEVTAPAPWRCRCDGVVWVAMANRAARQTLAPAVAGLGVPVAVIGGFLRYHDTPVGGYDEVFGAVALATARGIRASVPFMAVDSHSSIVGGRANWALPKTMAYFTGASKRGDTMTATNATWQVSARPRALPRTVPLLASGRLAQQSVDGIVRSSRLRVVGSASPALVGVDVNSAFALPSWLRPGSHPGLVLRDVSFTLDAP